MNDISDAQIDRLRKLLIVKHEYSDGMNECPICDEPLLDAAFDRLIALANSLNIMMTFARMLSEDPRTNTFSRAALKKALEESRIP